MNIHVRPLPIEASPETTLAAEGLPRRKWTLDEIERLSELGVFGGVDRPRERFELIGGEVVPMSAKGAAHETVKIELNLHFGAARPPDVTFAPETTLRNAPHDFREPDFVFWPRSVPLRQLAPAHVLLLIEVADSSLAYDQGKKAAYYASLGIPDYWVIDATRLRTRVHRAPGSQSWSDVSEHAHTVRLSALMIPGLHVRLTDLGLEPLVG